MTDFASSQETYFSDEENRRVAEGLSPVARKKKLGPDHVVMAPQSQTTRTTRQSFKKPESVPSQAPSPIIQRRRPIKKQVETNACSQCLKTQKTLLDVSKRLLELQKIVDKIVKI